MFGRTTVLITLVLALALPAAASARQTAIPKKAPTGLKAFLLRFNEPAKRNFPRTPSFGWKPTSQALSYDFELATSNTFRNNSVVWSAKGLKTPYTSVPVTLPWTTGHPYSLFARVRANKLAKKHRFSTYWSSAFGFNVRWTQIPAKLSAPNGLLRWTPIDGASAYEVLELGSDYTSFEKAYYVSTNVADMRDWFTFHQSSSWVGSAYWRVRAVRIAYGTLENGQTVAVHGPWSPVFKTVATTPSTSNIALTGTSSDVTGTVSKPAAHRLMPGFSWTGNAAWGTPYSLYRAYVFSDSDCVEPVLTGSIVGSPAWVPRLSAPLELPESLDAVGEAAGTILKDGAQSAAFDFSHSAVTTSETAAGDSIPSTNRLDLWDRDWPSGAYYWTVVPVRWLINTLEDDAFEYMDAQAAQDACAAGRIERFGRVSQAVLTSGTNAYLTGLSARGKLKSGAASKTPRLYGSSTLATWTPAIGADEYEVQIGKTRYPFEKTASVITPGTSATLSLKPGTWYYRVRGIDTSMPTAAQGMAWSAVRKVRILRPVYRLRW